MPAIGIPTKEAMVKGRQEALVFPKICFLFRILYLNHGNIGRNEPVGTTQVQFTLAPDQLQVGVFKSAAI